MSARRRRRDFKPEAIGDRANIIARIKQAAPCAEFSDPSWGRIEGDDFSIEINLGDDETISSLMFHVHGQNPNAIDIIASILKHLDLRALDIGAGDFFDPEIAAKSFEDWKAYRDHVIKR